MEGNRATIARYDVPNLPPRYDESIDVAAAGGDTYIIGMLDLTYAPSMCHYTVMLIIMKKGKKKKGSLWNKQNCPTSNPETVV